MEPDIMGKLVPESVGLRWIKPSAPAVTFALMLFFTCSQSAIPVEADDLGPQLWESAIHRQQLQVPRGTGTFQSTPPTIQSFSISADPSGLLGSVSANGTTITSDNAFFQNLGTNGRTCFSCHQPEYGWTVSAASVQQRFDESDGTDPIFRLVDGATCSTDDVSSLAARRKAYNLLLEKGLIRIALPLPAS